MEDSIILRSKETHYLSWEETYRAMAVESETWSDFDVAITDGVDLWPLFSAVCRVHCRSESIIGAEIRRVRPVADAAVRAPR